MATRKKTTPADMAQRVQSTAEELHAQIAKAIAGADGTDVRELTRAAEGLAKVASILGTLGDVDRRAIVRSKTWRDLSGRIIKALDPPADATSQQKQWHADMMRRVAEALQED